MNRNFCKGCEQNLCSPNCAIRLAPNNTYIEDMINNSKLSYLENFVCHKTAQELSNGKLSIQAACDDCGLCYISCPHTREDYTPFFTTKLEKVFFNDFGRASILFQSLFPNALVATEVQVKGNFRTKRVDLVIKDSNTFYLIKLLKTTDKVPFYTRSYNEVIEQYSGTYPNYIFKAICLVPAAKTTDIITVDADIFDISKLYSLIGGK